MSPKLVFAAISAAANVVGGIAKIKQAKAEAQFATAQIEYEMEADRLAEQRQTYQILDAHQRVAATHIAYGGASGAQMGGSFFAKSKANLSRRNRDLDTLSSNARLAQGRFGYQKLGVNMKKKADMFEGYMTIGKGIAQGASVGYEMGIGKTPTTQTYGKGSTYSGVGYDLKGYAPD